MIGLIQRVTHASVVVENKTIAQIDNGMLVLLGVEKHDDESIARKLAEKLLALRIFSDEEGKMNLNLAQSQGKLLIVSQFTLVADTRKGNRPGFSQAAPPNLGKALYEYFIGYCQGLGAHCQHGEFGADMKVSLCNDGPVTFHVQING